MKRKGTGKGIMAIGSLRTDGITTYMKQGRLIIRSANSMETAADSYGGLTDEGTLWTRFVTLLPSGKTGARLSCVAGDTEDIKEMQDLKDIDVAFLPCNQPYTMTTDQLVHAAKTIKPKVLFPYHYSDTPISKVRLLLSGTGIDVHIRNYQ